MSHNSNPRRRRWRQYSLRSLFVVMTLAALAAGWVAYCRDFVRQRHDFLKNGTPSVSVRKSWSSGIPTSFSAPLRLRGFEDRYVFSLTLEFTERRDDGELTSAQQEELDRVRRLFPECGADAIHIYTPIAWEILN